MQYELQLEWWCSPLHVPHVSFFSIQFLAMWPHHWHLRHHRGSLLSLHGWCLSRSRYIPSSMSLFAALGLFRDISAWAMCWFLLQLWGSLIHFNWVIESLGMSLVCSMSHKVGLSSTLIVIGMKGIRRLYVLSLMCMLPLRLSVSISFLIGSVTQAAASAEAISIMYPPFLRLMRVFI